MWGISDERGSSGGGSERVREAASFAMPTEWDDDEEREAYEGRAWRAVSRLRATIEDKWPSSTGQTQLTT